MFPPEAVSSDIDLRPGRPFSSLHGNLSSHMSFLFSYFSRVANKKSIKAWQRGDGILLLSLIR